MARDRAPDPAIELRLGQHYEGQRDFEEAVRWFTVVSKSEDAALAKVGRDRLAAIRARVPTVAELAREVLALAESRRDPARLEARVGRDDGKPSVLMEIGERGRRLMFSWIDDELTLDYRPTQTPICFNYHLTPELAANAAAAKLVIWSLPVDDPLWADLADHGGGGTLPMRGDAPVDARTRVQKILARLRAMDTPACVVDISR